jgi:hypothetical protein
VNAIKAHRENPLVVSHALAVIRNLCEIDQNVDRASAAGGVEAVASSLLLHKTDGKIQEQGCAAMMNLCQTDKNRRTARKVGVVVAGMPHAQAVLRRAEIFYLSFHCPSLFHFIAPPLCLPSSLLITPSVFPSI